MKTIILIVGIVLALTLSSFLLYNLIPMDNTSKDIEIKETPILDGIGSQSVDELTLLSFNVTASDVDLPH